MRRDETRQDKTMHACRRDKKAAKDKMRHGNTKAKIATNSVVLQNVVTQSYYKAIKVITKPIVLSLVLYWLVLAWLGLDWSCLVSDMIYLCLFQ